MVLASKSPYPPLASILPACCRVRSRHGIANAAFAESSGSDVSVRSRARPSSGTPDAETSTNRPNGYVFLTCAVKEESGQSRV